MSISQWFAVKIEGLYKLITNSFFPISSPLENSFQAFPIQAENFFRKRTQNDVKWVCFAHSREPRLSSKHAHFFSIVPPFVCVLEIFSLLGYRLCVSKHIDLLSLVRVLISH